MAALDLSQRTTWHLRLVVVVRVGCCGTRVAPEALCSGSADDGVDAAVSDVVYVTAGATDGSFGAAAAEEESTAGPTVNALVHACNLYVRLRIATRKPHG